MIRERTSYSCVCDGCGYEQFDDYWSEDAALAQAEDDGWTYCEDSQGDWETYCPNCHPMYVCHHCGLESDCTEPGWQERDGHVDCPNHLHADCRECRCHDIGTRYRLEYRGWSHELDLCPDHNPKRNRE